MRRAAAVVFVLLAFGAVAVFWGFVFHRQGRQAHGVAQTVPLAPVSSAPRTPVPPAGLTAIPLPARTSGALKVAIIGDDIDAGHYATGPNTRFRTLVLSALGAGGPVQVLGAKPIPGAGQSTAVTVPAGLDLAIVELGTTELATTSPQSFASNYSTLVAAIRRSSPKAAIVCAGTWSATGSAFDTAISQSCAAAKGTYVPLSPLYAIAADRGPAGITGFYGRSDGIEPNDAGHRAIAAALLKPLGIRLP